MPRRKEARDSSLGSVDAPVRVELEAIDRAFERVSRTRQSALSFLKRAGIVDKQGRLAKAYR